MHTAFHDNWFCGPDGFLPFVHGGLFHLLLWGLGLYLLYRLICLLVPGKRSATTPRNTQTDPLDILNRRYANGEIDRQEYQQRKEDLGL